MAKRHFARLSIFGFVVAVVPVACWLDGPDTFGSFDGGLSIACGAPPGVTMASAYPVASASGATSVVLGGSVTGGCPAYGVTLLGAFSATPVGSGYASWTATVPFPAFLGQPCKTAGTSNAPGYSVDTQVLVTGGAGANVWQDVTPTPCVALAATAAGCAAPAVQATKVYPAPASSGAPSSVVIAGTADDPECAIASLTLLGAYPAVSTGTNFATWTATVPIASLQSGACGAPGATASLGFAISAEVVVAGTTGLGDVMTVVDAGCVGLSLDPIAVCDPTPIVTATSLVRVDAGLDQVTGTVAAAACPVVGLQLFGAYPASSVGSSFLNWSAQVPAAVAATPCAAPDGSGKVSVTGTLIVPGSAGLPVAQPIDAGCLLPPGP